MALPLSAIPKPVAKYTTSLAADITSSATTLTVVTATDDSSNAISGVVGLTIGDEFIIGTKSGTSVTGCLRGVDVQDGTTEVTALKAAHIRGTPVVITDAPFLSIVYRLLNGTEGFPNQLKYVSTGYPTPSAAYDIATKAYVDAVAGGTPATFDAIVVAGNAGETVSAGQLLYFDTGTNNEWMKCDADTAATVDNVILGIAQGAGTDGNAITSGVLLWGLDENQSGMTAGDPQFASNTAGGISSSAGTVEVQVGAAKSATQLYFAPRYNQQLTEDQQDALAGSSGTPSGTNKFVTQADALRAPVYGASASGNDTYVITPTVAVAAYVDGQIFTVTPDAANTGAATLAVSGLSAISILRGDGTALVNNDLLASKPFTVRYVGGSFYLLSTPSVLTAGPTSDATEQHTHKTVKALAYNTTMPADTVENTLVTYTIPANRLGTKGGVRLKVRFTHTGNTFTTTGRFKIGSTTVYTYGAVDPGAGTSHGIITVDIWNNGAANAQISLIDFFGYTTVGPAAIISAVPAGTTASIDTTASTTASITFQKSNSGAAIVASGTIELLDRE